MIFSFSKLDSDSQEVINAAPLRPIDAPHKVIVNILCELQQTAQTDPGSKLSRGSRLRNKTRVTVTDMNIAKETEVSIQKRQRCTSTKKRKTTSLRTTRRKRDAIGVDSAQENENNGYTDKEANSR